MNRTRWIVGGAAVAVVLLVAFAVFRPDKLVVDQRVDEQLDDDVAAAIDQLDESNVTDPGAGAAPDGAAPDDAAPDDAGPDGAAATSTVPEVPVVTAVGGFGSHNDYTVTGTAAVVTQVDGSRQLVLQELMSDNGPDLQLYLSPVTGGQVDGGVKLGPLKGNLGTQAYDLPPEVDLGQVSTVVIWCERFSRAFGSATLA
jgi:hypothetical protein